MPPLTLRPIVKDYATTLRTSRGREGQPLRRECWGAVTTDGEWGFERIEDVGTPWIVVHHPRTPQAETATCTFGTLKAAREAVERNIDAWLPSILRAEHAHGLHRDGSPYGCPTCRDEWIAAREAVWTKVVADAVR
jgi:hypothetical protein